MPGARPLTAAAAGARVGRHRAREAQRALRRALGTRRAWGLRAVAAGGARRWCIASRCSPGVGAKRHRGACAGALAARGAQCHHRALRGDRVLHGGAPHAARAGRLAAVGGAAARRRGGAALGGGGGGAHGGEGRAALLVPAGGGGRGGGAALRQHGGVARGGGRATCVAARHAMLRRRGARGGGGGDGGGGAAAAVRVAALGARGGDAERGTERAALALSRWLHTWRAVALPRLRRAPPPPRS